MLGREGEGVRVRRGKLLASGDDDTKEATGAKFERKREEAGEPC